MSKLTIDEIVSIVISSQGAAVPRDGFNVGLIVGKTAGTGMNAEHRTITVNSLAGLIDAGYPSTSPEYQAAAMYFSQYPKPHKLVVGLNVGATEGSGSEAVTTYESWPDAIAACRAANQEWYSVYAADATALTTAEITAIAAYVETLTAVFFFEDGAAADITSADTDVFSVLKGLTYKRTFGLYSGTKYAGAAAMGRAMGLNNGTPRSAFTMAYKNLAGATPDDLTPTQVGLLQGKNANYYVSRGAYTVLEKGMAANGSWLDELIGLDQLANDMQTGVMDALAKTDTKIPYTDAGVLRLVQACNDACEEARKRGFLAPGVWRLEDVLDLKQGDTLNAGYWCQAEAVADQSAANRSLRVCPPIYACVILAGAVHSVAIKVIVE